MLSKDPNQGRNISMLYQQTYGTPRATADGAEQRDVGG